MNCVRCGSRIEEGSSACPSCGLKLKAAPKPPRPVRPRPQAPAGPQQPQPGGAAYPPPVSPGYVVPPPLVTEQQTGQPGVPPADIYAAAPPQETYPPGQAPGEAVRPGQYDDMWNTPPPSGGFPPPRKSGGKNQAPIALIIIIAVGIALIGGGAVAYFIFLRPGGTANVAQDTIDKYFNAVGSGDTETVKSLHTSDTQPPSEQLQLMSSTGGIMTYSDFELKTIDESAGEMSVEVVDFVITVSLMGQSESIRMSEMQSEIGLSENMVIELKEEGGKWLINEPVVLEPFEMTLPDTLDVPGTTVPLDGG